MKIHIVNAFINSNSSGGNAAGVVLLSSDFPEDAIMQSTATRVNLSETAFVLKTGEKSYAMRYFTPVTEVDLCGHATIAAFTLLLEKELIKAGEIYEVSTKAGRFNVSVETGGLIYMDMAKGEELFELTKAQEGRLCRLYTLPVGVCGELGSAVVSTGLKDIIFPVRNRDMLNRAVQDVEGVKEFSRELGVTGVHMFALEAGEIYCRNFAPLFGIDEEAATGTANGALTYYLYIRGLVDIGRDSIIIQGEAMGHKSMIFTRLTDDGGDILIRVGGYGSKKGIEADDGSIDLL